MSGRIEASASIGEARARWEEERRAARLLALFAGGAALTGLLLAPLLWGLGAGSAVLMVLGGQAAWHLVVRGVEAARERLANADPPRALAERGGLGITLLTIALFLLGASGALGMPGAGSVLVLGGLAYVGLSYAGRAWEVGRPRSFVRVRGEGRVISALRGTPVLAALEVGGYRLMTQCGRTGGCATCRVRVRTGWREWEERHYGKVLTPKQRDEGWVLACQAPLTEDLEIELFKPLVLRWPEDKTRPPQAARAIRRALPGFDCEACGYRTCGEYALAISKGEVSIARCHPGGRAVRERLKGIAEQLKLSTGE